MVDRDSTFARTSKSQTRYTIPWIVESASIPFCARETPGNPFPPCRWWLDTPRYVGSSSFPLFFFWWVIKCVICVKTCVSLRVAWLCYETRYVSIIVPRNDIRFLLLAVWFTISRSRGTSWSRHFDPASLIIYRFAYQVSFEESSSREKNRMERYRYINDASRIKIYGIINYWYNINDRFCESDNS